MHRTTIMLPLDLKERASRLARSRGVSFGELVRESLELRLESRSGDVREDSLYGDDAVYRGPAPPSLSRDHDRHLYGSCDSSSEETR